MSLPNGLQLVIRLAIPFDSFATDRTQNKAFPRIKIESQLRSSLNKSRYIAKAKNTLIWPSI